MSRITLAQQTAVIFIACDGDLPFLLWTNIEDKAMVPTATWRWSHKTPTERGAWLWEGPRFTKKLASEGWRRPTMHEIAQLAGLGVVSEWTAAPQKTQELPQSVLPCDPSDWESRKYADLNQERSPFGAVARGPTPAALKHPDPVALSSAYPDGQDLENVRLLVTCGHDWRCARKQVDNLEPCSCHVGRQAQLSPAVEVCARPDVPVRVQAPVEHVDEPEVLDDDSDEPHPMDPAS